MKILVTFLVLWSSLRLSAQTDDGLLSARLLGLDTTISGGAAFNEALLQCTPGYAFQFVDKSSPNQLKYLYALGNETLKIEYAYRQRSDDTSNRPIQIIFSQRIISDNKTMALIYNCMFGEQIQPEQLEAFSGFGRHFIFHDHDYHYSLLPDDYKPGYWVFSLSE